MISFLYLGCSLCLNNQKSIIICKHVCLYVFAPAPPAHWHVNQFKTSSFVQVFAATHSIVQLMDSFILTALFNNYMQSNQMYRVVSFLICLFSGEKASIKQFKEIVKVDLGKPLRLVCRVDGQPPPKVTWYKDGQFINRSKSNRLKYNFVRTR